MTPPPYPPCDDKILWFRMRFPRWWKRGCTRECWLIGKYAFKFPSLFSWRNFVMGLSANMQEQEWTGFSPRLCPIVWKLDGGWLNVMPRARALTDDEWLKVRKRGKAFYMGNRRDGASLPGEFKRDSFGVLNGKIVIVDYGN